MESGIINVLLCLMLFISNVHSQQLSPENTARLLRQISNSKNFPTALPQGQATAASTAQTATNIDQLIQQAPTSPGAAQIETFKQLIQQLQNTNPSNTPLQTQQSQPSTANNAGSSVNLQSMLPLAATGMLDGSVATLAATSALTGGRPSPLGTLMASNVLDVSDTGRGVMLASSLQQQQQQQKQAPNAQRPGLFNGDPMNNYLAARAFDMGDTTSNMMLLSGMAQQNPGQQQSQRGMQQVKRQQSSPGLFGNGPLGGYMTAKAFDLGDFASSVMMFNGLQQQPQGRQAQRQQHIPHQQQRFQQQSSFDPMLALLWAM